MNNPLYTETFFRLAAILIFITAVTISISFRVRAHKAGLRAGDQISSKREEKSPLLILRSVAGLSLWLSTLAYLINPAWMAWAQVPLPPQVRMLGVIIGVAGLPLIYWVFSSLGRNVTPTTAIRKEHTLVTFGPYRWVRHPLYSVGILNFLGLSLMTANLFIFLLAVGAWTAILLRTPLEESRLIEKFGEEYRQYMSRTGRYLPRVR